MLHQATYLTLIAKHGVKVESDHKPGKRGVLRDFYDRGKLGEFRAASGKIFNRVASVRSDICITQEGLGLQTNKVS